MSLPTGSTFGGAESSSSFSSPDVLELAAVSDAEERKRTIVQYMYYQHTNTSGNELEVRPCEWFNPYTLTTHCLHTTASIHYIDTYVYKPNTKI